MVAVVDPWRAASPQPAARMVQDPWSPATNTDHSSLASPTGGDLDEFDVITNRDRPPQVVNNANTLNNNGGTLSPDPFDLSLLGEAVPDSKQSAAKKSPRSFLGENSSLVNLDNLVTVNSKASPAPLAAAPVLSLAAANPFAAGPPAQPQPSLFQPAQVRPSINQIRQQPFGGSQPSIDTAWGPTPPQRSALPTPLLPSGQPNPFLS